MLEPLCMWIAPTVARVSQGVQKPLYEIATAPPESAVPLTTTVPAPPLPDDGQRLLGRRARQGRHHQSVQQFTATTRLTPWQTDAIEI